MNRKTTLWALLGAAFAGTIGAYMNCSGTDGGGSDVRTIAEPLEARMSGAIFTTLQDGSSVNHNIYEAKEDVYLDGGPGPRAPASAAGLPAGDYYFQVTDPSGKDLLSEDHISCRKVRINDKGVIAEVYSGTNYEWSGGSWQPSGTCKHQEGVDQDHSGDGAITVQLMPYDDTPNKGGVYKVWLTPVGKYTGNSGAPTGKKKDGVNGENWQPGNAHGFAPSWSKTDNYKVKGKKPCDPQLLTVRKFHDANMNGVQDSGEPDISGWMVTVVDPLEASNDYYTPVAGPDSVNASEGTWKVYESQPESTLVTASYLDGTQLTAYPNANVGVSVDFSNKCGESHEVVFGNVGVGDANICKVYDRDGDGESDEGEPKIPGWKITLSGTDVGDAGVGPTTVATGENGCADFGDLLPGEYKITEIVPSTGGWTATGPTEQTFTIESLLTDGVLGATSFEFSFTNVCTATANFGTKGYWHNKNGLTEITEDDITYVNGLAPYSEASSYFDDGDEPFDGEFSNGTPVETALGSSGDEVAPSGSAKAEISQFLVDANAGGDPREQLAQQLLAFIFNSRHRLDDAGAAIKLADGSFRSASDIIDEAIQVWESGTAAEQNAMASMLDGFNNNDKLPYVPFTPCDVTY